MTGPCGQALFRCCRMPSRRPAGHTVTVQGRGPQSKRAEGCHPVFAAGVCATLPVFWGRCLVAVFNCEAPPGF